MLQLADDCLFHIRVLFDCVCMHQHTWQHGVCQRNSTDCLINVLQGWFLLPRCMEYIKPGEVCIAALAPILVQLSKDAKGKYAYNPLSINFLVEALKTFAAYVTLLAVVRPLLCKLSGPCTCRPIIVCFRIRCAHLSAQMSSRYQSKAQNA
jgi:hypothetical protein